MKTFNFANWERRDLAENTLTGGGLVYEDIQTVVHGGETVFSLSNRKAVGHRVKFVEAFEDAAKGNEYSITMRVKLGDSCTSDRAAIVVGVSDPFALTPAFLSAPAEATKDAWTIIEFTHVLAEDIHSSVSVEQFKGDKLVAEEILVAEVKTELLHRAEAVKGEEDTRKTLWLIGDSITCDYSSSVTTRGWGMFIGEWFDDSKIKVNNRARAGFSTRSFVKTDGLAIWSYVCRRMKAGDYLIVSLGINDHSSSSLFRRTSVEEYAENLAIFADEAHKRGVSLILVTPTVTVENDPVSNYRRVRAEAMLGVAAEKKAAGYDITALDLNAHMMAFIEETVDKKGRDYLINTYFSAAKKADGSIAFDTTHHREAGSRKVASMIVELLDASDCSLREFRK